MEFTFFCLFKISICNYFLCCSCHLEVLSMHNLCYKFVFAFWGYPWGVFMSYLLCLLLFLLNLIWRNFSHPPTTWPPLFLFGQRCVFGGNLCFPPKTRCCDLNPTRTVFDIAVPVKFYILLLHIIMCLFEELYRNKRRVNAVIVQAVNEFLLRKRWRRNSSNHF